MDGTEERLNRELREAFGKDLPGEEFVTGVLSGTGRGGGEHTLAAGSAPSFGRAALRWAVAAVAAAVVVYAMSVRPGPAPDPTPAGEDDGAGSGRGPAVVEIPAEGPDWARTLEELGEYPFVRFRTRVPVPAGAGADREPDARIELRRAKGEERTTVRFDGEDLGEFGKVAGGISSRVAKAAEGIEEPCVRLTAWAAVPHAEVVDVLDAILAGGVTEIVFVGVPPRRPKPEGDAVRIRFSAGEKGALAAIDGSEPRPWREAVRELAARIRARPVAKRPDHLELVHAEHLDAGDRRWLLNTMVRAGVTKLQDVVEPPSGVVRDYAEGKLSLYRWAPLADLARDDDEAGEVRVAAIQALRKRIESLSLRSGLVDRLRRKIGAALVQLMDDRDDDVREAAHALFRAFWPGRYLTIGVRASDRPSERRRAIRRWRDELFSEIPVHRVRRDPPEIR